MVGEEESPSPFGPAHGVRILGDAQLTHAAVVFAADEETAAGVSVFQQGLQSTFQPVFAFWRSAAAACCAVAAADI
jgi:protein tyrosine phosphatase (PTP) superfamily phosphohydrolase (DUF442 family)